VATTAQLSLREVRSPAEMAAALAIRRAVFIDEQGVPEALEIDRYDSVASAGVVHVIGYLGPAAVATGRLLFEAPAGEHPHVGRVAVLHPWRRQGVGRQLMAALHEAALRRGFAGITLAAQLHAIGFYERLGYVARGEVFLDAGIEHRWMDVDLAGSAS
jgi:predicted GNAT family N-acyltransferase